MTREEIERARTPAGGWTKAQLAAWGVPWPPPKGWRDELGRRTAALASAIEARRAETAQHGSVADESAVAKPDAQGNLQ